jgi:hypothetical protein
MTIAIDVSQQIAFPNDRLSGTTRANVIDRWIYVFTATSFIGIVLTGFVPDSIGKIAGIRAGTLPPFPLALHFHAVLMGSFLLLLLGQTVLVALDKRDWHMQLGIASVVLIPALVLATLVAVPTIYRGYWNVAQSAPAPVRQQIQGFLPILDDILLIQLRVAVIFPVLMWLALRSRTRDPGLHKRLIFLATAPLLAAAFDRIQWLPTTMPGAAVGSDLYTLLAVSPLFIWDLTRNQGLHRAYFLFAVLYVPLTAVVYSAWDTPWWHGTARHIMGV